jgi:hypothetical protein
MSIPTEITAHETNTGGGSMVTMLESPSWDYVVVVSDEAAAIYKDAEAFWDGAQDSAITATWIKR